MEDSIPQLNILINSDRIHDGALEIIRQIRPEWTPDTLQFKIFTDGITNRLVGVYRERDMRDMVLIRVYGENTDLFIDRRIEFRNMRTMYKAGLSAPIYCTFLNGISYGYSAGTVLDEKTVRDPKIAVLIAENMARMHTLKPLVATLHPGVDSTACLFTGIKKFLLLIGSALPLKSSSNKRHRILSDIGKLQSEATFLEQKLNSLNSPIVFCHNDLLLKNIVFDQKHNKVTFIDFEYSDYNYQAFDIANHFCEFCGVDDFDPNLYPTHEFQLNWLTTYLRKWHALTDLHCELNTPSLEQQAEKLYQTVEKFSLAAHLYWGLWAMVQVSNSSIDFDYGAFAVKRLEEYFKRKNELFGNP